MGHLSVLSTKARHLSEPLFLYMAPARGCHKLCGAKALWTPRSAL